MEQLKNSDIIGDIKIDLDQFDVLVTARKNRPIVAIDGIPIYGVCAVSMIHNDSGTVVTLSFNDWIKSNPEPLNDLEGLRRLFETNPDGLSVRGLLIKRHLGEHFYQGHQRDLQG
ncbi:hypothetical protein NKE68_04150 [Streptococcus suis]|uniref:hypothetical protein n=1 Tax=Streptococcus suis TaxID=1307 RepID=UPI00209ACDBE|nr:hypothetical protein [Streptococcus suis]MCO8241137.1 hypothetical protein [Streptococcus suis]